MGANKELLRRKRKMLLLLPVVMIPLLTIGFYALGGGRGGRGGKVVLTRGLNMSLPMAKFDPKKKMLNKLGFYKQSDEDSIRLRERRKMDPYYGWKDSLAAADLAPGMNSGVPWGLGSMMMTPRNGLIAAPTASGNALNNSSAPLRNGLNAATSPADLRAMELMQKLELLKGVLKQQEQGALSQMPTGGAPGTAAFLVTPSLAVRSPAGYSPALPREAPGSGQGTGDADLDKLNTLMDKVLRVRYPGAYHDTTPVGVGGPAVQLLTTPQPAEVMTTLPVTGKEDVETGFIDLEQDARNDSLAGNMIAAVVDGAQTLVSGEEVALRTAEAGMLCGVRIPLGTALTGKATLAGERLLITVNAIRVGSRVVPVALDVVGMDGIPGIRVKGSLDRDVSKESAGDAVSSVGLTSADGSLAGEATAAGVQTAKNLLSRKVRLVRVGLPGGYRILLRNSKVNH